MIHVVACTDANYVVPTCVMIYSVVLNNPGVCFHIIVDDSVADSHKYMIRDCGTKNGGSVYLYPVDLGDLKSFPSIGSFSKYISKATYYRLFLPDILPHDIHKVIYLDSDVIVRHSLEELWNFRIDDCAIAGSIDFFDAHIGLYNRLEYPMDKGYINAGVLLINLDLCRNNLMITRCLDFLENNASKIRAHDQDVLNYVLQDEKTILPLKFNLQSGFLFKPEYVYFDFLKYREELETSISDPVIIHYTDFPKPWIQGCIHPYRNEYLKYAYHSGLKNFHIIKRKESIKQILRRLLIRMGVFSASPNYYRSDLSLERLT